MGFAEDPPRPGNPAPGESGPQPPQALEERVARLERELEALRRQIAVPYAAPPPPPIAAEVRVATAHQPTQTQPVPRYAQAATGAPPAAYTAYPPEPPPPPPAYRPPISSPQPARPRESLENRLGSQIFNRIGILLLLIGTAWFLKYAVDHEWIGPTGRVVAGLAAGAGIVLWSERFRRKGFGAFSYSLKALGSGVLYLSLWAAFQLYHLLPAPAALGLMVLVTAWNAWMAWAQDSELLAVYALAGGFATPVLLSTGGNQETFLFTYLLAIDIATVVLVRLRQWPRLLLGAFPLTVLLFIAWYSPHFATPELAITSVFIVLFAGTFSSVTVRLASVRRISGAPAPGGNAAPRTNTSTLIEDILLPLANAAFLSLGFYSALQDSGNHNLLPWLMIALAAVYLGFMRLPQSRTASAINLSLAVVFLTIAVPLKASGHWITVSWLVEGLALLWVATRLAPAASTREPSEAYASHTLRWLALAALLLGFCGIFADSISSGLLVNASFFSGDTATSLTGIAVFAAVAWLTLRTGIGAEAGSMSWPKIAVAAFIAIDLVAVLLTLRELTASGPPGLHAPFQTAEFVTALIGLAVFAGVVAVSLRLAPAYPKARFWTNCAALSTIAFNLIAVLTGVREIAAIWELSLAVTGQNPEAALQQALAISGFLMLYGAALLAAGFWKRSAFLRWQGLLLLIFTIFKAFLYDMRNLSQGYRVVSFLGLGALLMAISFAYQKDWLNLRDPQPDVPPVENEAAR